MRCGNRNNASYELRTNSQEFLRSSYALWPQNSVRTPREFVRTLYGLAGVRTEFVCAAAVGIMPLTNSVPAPREFVRAPYELRSNSPELVWTPHSLWPQE